MIRLLPNVLLGSALSVLNVFAQSPRAFVPTGSMATARIFPTATLLKDGRVLIAGGYKGNATASASAELYDPSTGTFTLTGSMTAARWWHTATLLSDGRVLIAGGQVGRAVNSAELYNPATGTFTGIGNMAGSHSAANLLEDGRVLMTGSTSAEIYDPATGAFTLLGPLEDAYGTAVLLKDGQVLVPNYKNVSLYDIRANSLQLVTSLPGNHSWSQTATLLSNGKVLIAAGWTDSGFDSTADEAGLYDPRRRTLEGTGLLLFSRVYHTATLLPGGRVLIVGGYNGEGYDSGDSGLPEAEQYDPSTGSFTHAGTVVYIRSAHTATLLPDGRVLIAGGVRYDNPPAEIYIPPLRAASAASLSGPLAPESLGSVFGSRLALATEVANDPLSSLPTTMGGISLRIRDSSGAVSLAPLLYVSPSQINFEVPAGIARGNVSLEIVNAPTQVSAVAAQVNDIAPGLFAFDDNTPVAYALRIEPDGKQTVLSVRNTIVLDERPVYLVLYATGIRNRSSLANVRATIGGASMPADYAGPEGSGVPGLDQVNLRLTSSLKGIGIANLVLAVDGIPSNTVSVDIR